MQACYIKGKQTRIAVKTKKLKYKYIGIMLQNVWKLPRISMKEHALKILVWDSVYKFNPYTFGSSF